MKQKIELYEERDFGGAFTVPFQFFKTHFKELTKAVLLLAGPLFVIAGFGQALYQNMTFGLIGGAPEEFEENMWILLIYQFGSLFVFLLAFIFLYTVLYEYFLQYKNDQDTMPDYLNVVKRSFRHLGKVLIVTFLGGIILTIGFMLCLAPGIYIWPMFSLLIPIMVFEKKGFGDAVTRAFDLVKDNWLITFGVLFLMTLLGGVISYVFRIPAAIPSIYYMFAGAEAGFSIPTWLKIVNIVLNAIAYLGLGICSLLAPIAMIFHYFSLVEQKEGIGIAKSIEKLDESFEDIP